MWPPLPQRDAFHAYWPAHRSAALRLMLLSSAVALCYNLAHSLMIRRISAVATTVVGEFKILALLLLSAFLLGERCGKRRGWGT
jgi:drug/metabolite transporter (DMT)-like permease